MGDGRAPRTVEAAVEAVAAACLAAALAFAAYRFGGEGNRAVAGAAAAFAAAYLAARTLLRRIGGESRPFPLPAFAPAALGPGWADIPDELLLTAEMALAPAATPDGEPLVLDDILSELDPQSRVVQLFAPPAIPTAGELQAHIDRHLRNGPPDTPPDASADLHAALDLLRRSLR